MEYIETGFILLFVIFANIVSMRIYMEVANKIGEAFGIGRFFIYLMKKVSG